MNLELTDEQRMFQKLARDFTAREIEPAAAEIDREGVILPSASAVIKKMAEASLTGISIPEK